MGGALGLARREGEPEAHTEKDASGETVAVALVEGEAIEANDGL